MMMQRSLFVLACALCVPIASCATNQPSQPAAPASAVTEQEAQTMKYPPTRRGSDSDTFHGVEVADPYRWLEDADDAEVRAWMRGQNEYTRSYLRALPARPWLEERLSELFYIDAVGAPTRRGEKMFVMRRAADQEKYVLYVSERGGPERVLIDPNTLSEDGSTALGAVAPSRDGALLAYTLKPNNADEATLYVMDVATGQTRDQDVIAGTKYADPSWTPDNKGFYYTLLPTDESIPVMDRPGYAEVRYHAIGTDPKSDPIVVPSSGNPQEFVGAEVTHDGRALIRYRQKGWNQTDLWWRPIDQPDAPWRPIVEGEDAIFLPMTRGSDLYLLTNFEAPNYKLLKLSMRDPSLKKAEVAIAERPDAVLDGVRLVGDKIVAHSMRRARSELTVHDGAGKVLRAVELPSLGAVSSLKGEPESDEFYYSFTSFTTPPQIYASRVDSPESKLWARIEVPIDPSRFQVDQVMYPSKDGTEVSMFIVTKKGIERDGSTPFLLYGYGGFNVSLMPSFRSSIYPWLEAGGGYAVPNLRGGGEYGESWHRDGMLAKKENVFDDFEAAAEYLIRQKYTRPDKLAIYGGSNGGLLVGAAMTRRPELFGAVVCAVPLLDMVRYHLFGSGKTWIPEYGSADDPELFPILHRYSPYHRVRDDADYPALLMLSADSDDRVDPMHARKFVAAVQAADPDADPILLRVEENAGHGGGDMVKKWIENGADMYAFLMAQLGLKAPR